MKRKIVVTKCCKDSKTVLKIVTGFTCLRKYVNHKRNCLSKFLYCQKFIFVLNYNPSKLNIHNIFQSCWFLEDQDDNTHEMFFMTNKICRRIKIWLKKCCPEFFSSNLFVFCKKLFALVIFVALFCVVLVILMKSTTLKYI